VDPIADQAHATSAGPPTAADASLETDTPFDTDRDPEIMEGLDQPGSAGAAVDEHWSPWGTPYARWSWGLLAIFAAIYFAVAILTSKEFADLAATMVFGLPLGFLLGVGMITAGLVITRLYLVKVEA